HHKRKLAKSPHNPRFTGLLAKQLKAKSLSGTRPINSTSTCIAPLASTPQRFYSNLVDENTNFTETTQLAIMISNENMKDIEDDDDVPLDRFADQKDEEDDRPLVESLAAISPHENEIDDNIPIITLTQQERPSGSTQQMVEDELDSIPLVASAATSTKSEVSSSYKSVSSKSITLSSNKKPPNKAKMREPQNQKLPEFSGLLAAQITKESKATKRKKNIIQQDNLEQINIDTLSSAVASKILLALSPWMQSVSLALKIEFMTPVVPSQITPPLLEDSPVSSLPDTKPLEPQERIKNQQTQFQNNLVQHHHADGLIFHTPETKTVSNTAASEKDTSKQQARFRDNIRTFKENKQNKEVTNLIDQLQALVYEKTANMDDNDSNDDDASAEIIATGKRRGCPRCEGVGWTHNEIKKHEKHEKMRCKHCSTCIATGFTHPDSSKHLGTRRIRCAGCQQCTHCDGLGVYDKYDRRKSRIPRVSIINVANDVDKSVSGGSLSRSGSQELVRVSKVSREEGKEMGRLSRSSSQDRISRVGSEVSWLSQGSRGSRNSRVSEV
ncbi:hypothetical protein HK096_006188, partial [Nowakowskiella sp. JEL0078]